LSWVKGVSLAGVDPRVNNPVCCHALLPGGEKLQEKAWVGTGTNTVRVISSPSREQRIIQAADARHT